MLVQSIKKEAIIIINDLHSLAVLLLLPITFMLIMTLAMGEKQENLVSRINIKIESQTDNDSLEPFKAYLEKTGFKINDQDDIDATISFDPNFDQSVLSRTGNSKISLLYAEHLSPQSRIMIGELVKVALSKIKLHFYMQDVGDFDADLPLSEKVAIVQQGASVDYLLRQKNQEQLHNAPTLYSIPSWLIFGIYFIVLPISTTFIKEKECGTLLRIYTYPISNHYYLFNKALSYSAVSCLQWGLLSLVGLLLIPKITGQAVLDIQNVPLYFLSAISIIFAAIGFAFLLASLINTYEQAIVLGGGVNIILAAFSGFMVPIDIMPESLANLAQFSPMYWSAELIKHSLAGDSILLASNKLTFLLVFGGICYTSALIIFNNKQRQLSWK